MSEKMVDQERRWKDEFDRRKKIRNDIKNFCDVMSNIKNANESSATNLCDSSRY